MVTQHENPVAHLNEYELHHLVAHLKGWERYDDLHRLLALETSKKQNAWYEAKEAIGATEAYIADIELARKLVEEKSDIGLQCRYALIVASFNSSAKNIPPELVSVLVAKGIWTPEQGVTYYRQISDQGQRIKKLIELVPYLPEPLLLKELDAAHAIKDAVYRANMLEVLAPHLPEPSLLKELDAARAIENVVERVETLFRLAPHLPKSLKKTVQQEAMTASLRLFDNYWTKCDDFKAVFHSWCRFLMSVVPYLSGTLKWRVLGQLICLQLLMLPLFLLLTFVSALAMVSLIGSFRLWLISSDSVPLDTLIISPLLFLSICFHITFLPTIEESFYLIGIILRIIIERIILPIFKLPFLWLYRSERANSSCIKLIEHIENNEKVNKYLLLRILGNIFTHFQGLLRTKNRYFDRYLAYFAYLGVQFPAFKDFSENVFKNSHFTNNEKVSKYLPQVLKELAPYLTETFLLKALNIAYAIEDAEIRAETLTVLAPYLPEALLPNVLMTVKGIEDTYYRIQVLTALVPYLPVSQFEKALADFWTIKEDATRAKILIKLTPHLPKNLLQVALVAAQGIQNEWYRVQVLTELTPHLQEALRESALREALKGIQAIGNTYQRVEALTGLVPHLPEALLQEAIKIAQGIQEKWHRIQILTALAPYLKGSLQETILQGALIDIQAIEDQYQRTEALKGLIPHLSEALLQSVMELVMELVQEIQDEWYQAQILMTLRSYMAEPPPLPDSFLREMLRDIWTIQDVRERVEALAMLAPHLPESLLVVAFKTSWVMRKRNDEHAQMLAVLAPHLSETLLQDAVTIAKSIDLSYKEFGASPDVSGINYRFVMRSHSLSSFLLRLFLMPIFYCGNGFYGIVRKVSRKSRRISYQIPCRIELLLALSGGLILTFFFVALFVDLEGMAQNPFLMTFLSSQWLLVLILLLPNAISNILKYKYGLDIIVGSMVFILVLSGGLILTLFLVVLIRVLIGDLEGMHQQLFLTSGLLSALILLLPVLLELLQWVLASVRIIKRENAISNILDNFKCDLVSIMVSMSKFSVQYRLEFLRRVLLKEALATVQTIQCIGDRFHKLIRLAPYLPESLLWQGIEVVRGIDDKYCRGRLLEEFAFYLWELLLQKTPVTTQTTDKIKYQIKILTALAPHLPEPLKKTTLREVFRDILAIEENVEYQSEALTEILPHLSESFLPEVLTETLATVKTLENAVHQTIMLMKLAPYLPESLLIEALAVVQTIQHAEYRAEALTKLIPRFAKFSHPALPDLWQELIDTWSNCSRKNLVAGLHEMAPVISQLGEDDAIAELFHAIQDVGRWWP